MRILVPILVMVVLVWALRRLNARWEAEAAQQESEPEPRQEKSHRQRSAAPILERGGPIGELPN
ncbi:MAG: hypothetical protein P8129_12835 [Anaerolineae bacterium]